MSDEFIKLATQEINQEISSLFKILNECKDNAEIISNASNIEKHTHKIKGLAPMMGKEDLGELASKLDVVFKKIIDGNVIEFFKDFHDSVILMKNHMSASGCDLSEIKERIEKVSVNLGL
jgi:HPt (histidine-containing phosphotransfer) domain-containing protein